MAGSTTTGDARGIKKPPKETQPPTTSTTIPPGQGKGVGYDVGRGIAFLKGMKKRKNQGLDFE